MKLYTKFGDEGQTALGDGTRVWKDDLRVEAYGTVDELNAVLGWCRVAAEGTDFAEQMLALQRALFVMGAQLAAGPAGKTDQPPVSVKPDDVIRLEQWIDEATALVAPLSHFVIPGGSELAARLHVARTVCRRAERAVISLHRAEQTAAEAIVYLNRLGDLLFAWARVANRQANCPDMKWPAD
jgi:cob(I)alamin adenosyltransferase